MSALKSRVVRVSAAVLVAASLARIALGAPNTASQSIEPSTIELGGQAQLTITASGSEAPSITPPMVPGLEFLAVGQSQQVQIVNGVSSATTTVTYQVIPQQAGVFTIPSALPGAEPVILTVKRGSGAAPGGTGQPAAPPGGYSQGSSSSLPADSTRQGASGAAFVRLRLAKHDLYVGEMIPVDIQVGARDGMVASLNAPPMLNGDAFTLSKLPSNPERTEEIIDGKPYIVFTWHTALVAIKPGTLSLTIDMPLTVRLHTAPRPGAGFFGGSGFEDLFNDPAFQNFFGTSVQRDVTVSSSPETFTVQALPTQGRPADFSGAVGHFTVKSEVSQDKAAEGDPITLKMSVAGEGDFARVSSPMLHDGDGWKAYTPTATFKPADDIGLHGEKVFEQPLIATQPGERTIPEVPFSWFDPTTRRYEEAHTAPLTVAIAPAPGGTSVARAAPPLPTDTTASDAAAPQAWRPDHVDAGGAGRSLTPDFFQPVYMTLPPLLIVALSSAWLWIRRAERAAAAPRRPSEAPPVETIAHEMDAYESAGNVELFFQTARSALQRALSSRWAISPAEVTTEEVTRRLGPDNEITRAFILADEATYSAWKPTPADLRQWKRTVLRNLDGGARA